MSSSDDRTGTNGSNPVARRPSEGEAHSAPARRPYAPPILTCHGRLTEVTRFGGSQIEDSGGGLGPVEGFGRTGQPPYPPDGSSGHS